MNSPARPVVALTLGDPAGIGPELMAKLLARHETADQAIPVIVGDPWVWETGKRVAGVELPTETVRDLSNLRNRPAHAPTAFLPVHTIHPSDVTVAQVSAACGASVLRHLDLCMDAALRHEVDAICFAPLNKHAMKLGGLKHEDELHHFAQYLGVTSYFCEFNTLGDLWTSRVSSHIPLKDAVHYLRTDRIIDAARLIHRSLIASGKNQVRIAIAAFNPHGGDGGMCGREEIEIIQPAVAALQAEGVPVEGPYPADTIFLKARDGLFDAVVTLYHDQGQIAIKLMGFSQGVTVQGGLPVPITTPAHGTAFDIAGQGIANVNATAHAFALAARMGAHTLAHR